MAARANFWYFLSSKAVTLSGVNWLELIFLKHNKYDPMDPNVEYLDVLEL